MCRTPRPQHARRMIRIEQLTERYGAATAVSFAVEPGARDAVAA
jgi:hypothetical protein